MKVAVGMSGGIDSSFAAYHLLEKGYEVVGLTMIGSSNKTEIGKCCSLEDINDARVICNKLGIEHIIIDFHKEFEEKVIQPFINQYLEGKTPNPCIICNKEIKFKILMDYALENLKTDYYATGHYAKILKEDGKYFIAKGNDRTKDQSYFLYQISRERLPMLLFPCGDFLKSEIRDTIGLNRLINPYSKKESYDICFVKGDDYAGFIQERAAPELMKKGFFINEKNEKLFPNRGLINYTIGQRKGLGFGSGERKYIRKFHENGDITIGDRPYIKGLTIKSLNFFKPVSECTETYEVKIRYKNKGVPCKIVFNPNNGNKEGNNSTDLLYLEFTHPVDASSPGQSAVLYEHDYIIGGGIIDTIDFC